MWLQSLRGLCRRFFVFWPGEELLSGVVLQALCTPSLMLQFREFLKSGHAPTLWSSFLYFGFSCAIWVINGAMAPFIQESFRLTPTQMGMMLSIPIFAGALMRFPLGILTQYIGRKNATLVEMAGIFAAMSYGFLLVQTYHELLALGVLLGVAGASFGVALSLGSGSFLPRYKGLAMGIVGAGIVGAGNVGAGNVGAGNVGTAVAALLAPMLAQKFGWQAVYGFAAVSVAGACHRDGLRACSVHRIAR